MYTLQEIANICDGELVSNQANYIVEHFNTDSRKSAKANAMFVALKGERFDGHAFIADEINKGTKAFLIEDKAQILNAEKHSWILVENTLSALQKIAKYHRQKLDAQFIGITGSYGKTIVKEWLYQLMSPDFYVGKSPKSYNSQLGVPLSIYQINQNHQYALIEAGISQSGEMENLENIIQPQIGIFTALGNAHAQGFENIKHKLQEKLKLFQTSKVIIYKQETDWIDEIKKINPAAKLLTWTLENDRLQVGETSYSLPNKSMPFYKENIANCIAVLQHLGIDKNIIEKRINNLEGLPMRLEVIDGIFDSTIINDSYANDIAGLSIALDYAHEINKSKVVGLVLSEFAESGLTQQEINDKIENLLSAHNLSFIALIGDFYFKNQSFFNETAQNVLFFKNTQALIQHFDKRLLTDKIVVVKGARKDQLEQFVNQIKSKSHQTIWEINLSDLIENLNYFKSLLNPGVKLLAMVKATAYGTEANKIAHTLQNQRIDYFGVAYPEEGVSLRQQGIELPILVMNTSSSQFNKIVDHSLELQLYSLTQAKSFIDFCKQRNILDYPVHLKLETGMNRLGFTEIDLPELIELLKENKSVLKVKGILSHLATASDSDKKDFTLQQIAKFKKLYQQLLPLSNEKPIIHLLNTAGIEDSDLPQFDMVRLGIGLHGVSAGKGQNHIKQVGSLIATISQVKEIKKGEAVGYSRNFIADTHKKIATISIGYADGYDRRLGNGNGEVIIRGKKAATIGSICMDMCMVDISHIPDAQPGDEVILTNDDLPISQLAEKINTISYELLTSVSTRVQRRFIYE